MVYLNHLNLLLTLIGIYNFEIQFKCAIERSEVADLTRIYVDFARLSESGNSNIHGAATASPRRNNPERVITFHRNSLPRNKNKRILEDKMNGRSYRPP